MAFQLLLRAAVEQVRRLVGAMISQDKPRIAALLPETEFGQAMSAALTQATAAASLPAGEALLLRGNGALTLGRTPGLAVARMWLLSAACDASLSALAAGTLKPLTAAEIASWRAVADDLLPRLWQHLRRRAAGEPPDAGELRDRSPA